MLKLVFWYIGLNNIIKINFTYFFLWFLKQLLENFKRSMYYFISIEHYSIRY